MKAAHEAANSLIGVGDAAAVQKTAGLERFEQQCDDSLKVSSCGELPLFSTSLVRRVANQFVETDGNRLAEVHGNVLFARGNPDEPMAIAEGVIGKAKFLGAKEQSYVTGAQSVEDPPGAVFWAADEVLKVAIADRRGSHDQGAIRHRVGYRLIALGTRQNARSADRRARPAKGGWGGM